MEKRFWMQFAELRKYGKNARGSSKKKFRDRFYVFIEWQRRHIKIAISEFCCLFFKCIPRSYRTSHPVLRKFFVAFSTLLHFSE